MFEQTNGTATLLFGRANVSSSCEWRCTYPGSVVVKDEGALFYQLGFSVCEQGSYSIGRASTRVVSRGCGLCPFGAACLGGSNTSDGLLALRGFYGQVNASLQASFYLCPQGYCCDKDEGCQIDFCQGGRTGVLCGQCPEGSGLRFFKEGCGRDDECSGSAWFVPAVCGVGVGFVVFLVKTTGGKTTATLGVLMFFYQVASLVKSSEWRHTSPEIVFAVQSAANQAPTGSSAVGGWGGVCLSGGMTQVEKLAAGLLFR